VITKENNEYFNRLLWVRPDGHTDYYDKRHLFRPGGENDNFTQGQKVLTVELKGWKIRPLVCYDLRFPVWSRNKPDPRKGTLAYDLLVYVTNWPAARSEVFETLLKARAIENSSYCIGLSRTGTDGEKVSYNGHSLVSDYRGRTQWRAGEKEVIETIVLNYGELEKYRNEFPVHLDGDDFNLVY
jgi:predicted amidohydrolase